MGQGQFEIVKSEPLPQSGPLTPGMLMAPTMPRTPDVRPMALDVDGKHVLLPLRGDFRNDQAVRDAIQRYHATGEHLGIFASLEAAKVAAQAPAAAPGITAAEPLPAQGAPSLPEAPGGPSGLGGMVRGAMSGIGHLAQGLAEPIDPDPMAEQSRTLLNPVGRAAMDAARGHSSPSQFVDTATSGARDLIGMPTPGWDQPGFLGGAQTGMLAAQGQLFADGARRMSQGDFPGGAAKIAEWLIPFAGPMLSKAGDDMERGEIMRGIGESITTALMVLWPFRGASPLGRTTTDAALPGQAPAGTVPATPLRTAADANRQRAFPPGEQIVPPGQPMKGVATSAPVAAAGAAGGFTPTAAGPLPPSPHTPNDVAQFADANQLPIPVDVRTGNPALRGLRGLNAGSSFAAGMAEDNKLGQFAGRAQQVGSDMAAQLSPDSAPDLATGGPTLGDELARIARTLRTQSHAKYAEVDRLVNDPALRQQITTQQRGRVGGHEGVFSVPTAMQLPIDLSDLKRIGAPLRKQYERMRDLWPEARKASSPAWPAIKNIIEGPDVMSFETLDANLSGLKSIAREEGGVAKLAVAEVERALQDKLASLPSSDLRTALGEARKLWAQQAIVGELADKLRAVKANDSYKALSLDDIESLKKVAPDAVPVIARGWLQQMLNVAFEAPGHFDHAAKLYGDWMRMNNRVKFETFGPARAKAITLFLRTAAEVMRAENTSKTAHVMALTTKGVRLGGSVLGVLWNPLAAGAEAMTEVGQAALVQMLWSPNTARLMTSALTMAQPVAEAMGRSAVEPMRVSAELLNAARSAGVTIDAAQMGSEAVKTAPSALPNAAQNQSQDQRVGPYTVRPAP